MKLSKENFDKLNKNFLYKRQPCNGGSEPYWCRNWTFICQNSDDGKAFMVDTYFRNSSIEVTDENIDFFKFVFDFREVRKIRDSEIDEYDDADLIWAATDSGGYSCGHIHWVKNDCKKSISKLINKTKNEISSLQSKIRFAEAELSKLEQNELNTECLAATQAEGGEG